VGTGPLEVEVVVLEAEVEAEAELPTAGLVMLPDIVAVDDDPVAAVVDLIVETVLANTIWGA
jgi:hypothetical protein